MKYQSSDVMIGDTVVVKCDFSDTYRKGFVKSILYKHFKAIIIKYRNKMFLAREDELKTNVRMILTEKAFLNDNTYWSGSTISTIISYA